MARGHPGAAAGERAAWEILRNLQEHSQIDFADAFCRLDSRGKRAAIQLLVDMATGASITRATRPADRKMVKTSGSFGPTKFAPRPQADSVPIRNKFT
jgi:hypothetical protein